MQRRKKVESYEDVLEPGSQAAMPPSSAAAAQSPPVAPAAQRAAPASVNPLLLRAAAARAAASIGTRPPAGTSVLPSRAAPAPAASQAARQVASPTARPSAAAPAVLHRPAAQQQAGLQRPVSSGSSNTGSSGNDAPHMHSSQQRSTHPPAALQPPNGAAARPAAPEPALALSAPPSQLPTQQRSAELLMKPHSGGAPPPGARPSGGLHSQHQRNEAVESVGRPVAHAASSGAASSPGMQQRYVLPQQAQHQAEQPAAAEPGPASAAAQQGPAPPAAAGSDACTGPPHARPSAAGALEQAGPPSAPGRTHLPGSPSQALQPAGDDAHAPAPALQPPGGTGGATSYAAAPRPPFGSVVTARVLVTEGMAQAAQGLAPPPADAAVAEAGSGQSQRRPLPSQPPPAEGDQQLSLGLSGSGGLSPRSTGADGSAAPAGFGSVLHFASEEGSRRNSLAPAQAAAAMALAAEAMARAASAPPTGASAPASSDGSAESALPSDAVPQQPGDEAGCQDTAEAEPEAGWAGEPATTFQTLSRPLFAPADDPVDDAAVFQAERLTPAEQQLPPVERPGERVSGSPGPGPLPQQQCQPPEQHASRGWHAQQWDRQTEQQPGVGGLLEEPEASAIPPEVWQQAELEPAPEPSPVSRQPASQREAATSASEGPVAQPNTAWQAAGPASAWQAAEAAGAWQQATWQAEAEPEQAVGADGTPQSGHAAAEQGQRQQQVQGWAALRGPPAPASGVQSPDRAASPSWSAAEKPTAPQPAAASAAAEESGQVLAWQPDTSSWQTASGSPWQADSAPDPWPAPLQAEQVWPAGPGEDAPGHAHGPAASAAAPPTGHSSAPAQQAEREVGPSPASRAADSFQPQQLGEEQQPQQAGAAPAAAAQAQGPPPQLQPAGPPLDPLDLDSPALLAAAAAGGFSEYAAEAVSEAGARTVAEFMLQGVTSPTAAQETAAAPGVAESAAAANDDASYSAAAEEVAAPPKEQAVQSAEPRTWYDDAGYCWCDTADGGRYWFDAAAQQWQYYGPAPPPEPAAPAAGEAAPAVVATQPEAAAGEAATAQQPAEAPSLQPGNVEEPQPAHTATATSAAETSALEAEVAATPPPQVLEATATSEPTSDEARLQSTAPLPEVRQPAGERAAQQPARPVQLRNLPEAALVLGDGPTALSPVMEEGEELLAEGPSPVDAPPPHPTKPEHDGRATATAWSMVPPLQQQPWGAAEVTDFPDFPSPAAEADFPDFPFPSAAAAAAAEPTPPEQAFQQQTVPPFAVSGDSSSGWPAEDEFGLGPGQQQQEHQAQHRPAADWQQHEQEEHGQAEPHLQPPLQPHERGVEPRTAAVPAAAPQPAAAVPLASTGPFADHDENAGGTAAWPPAAWQQQEGAAEDDEWLAGSPPPVAVLHPPATTAPQAPLPAEQQAASAAAPEPQLEPRAAEAWPQPAAAIPFQPSPPLEDEDWLQVPQPNPWQQHAPQEAAGSAPDVQPPPPQPQFEPAADDSWLASHELEAWQQPAAVAAAEAPPQQPAAEQPPQQQEWLQPEELAAWQEPEAEAAAADAKEQQSNGWLRQEQLFTQQHTTQPDVLALHPEVQREQRVQEQQPNGWVHQQEPTAWKGAAEAEAEQQAWSVQPLPQPASSHQQAADGWLQPQEPAAWQQQATGAHDWQAGQQAWQTGQQQWHPEVAPEQAAAEPLQPVHQEFVPMQPAPGSQVAEAGPQTFAPHYALGNSATAAALTQPLQPAFGGAEPYPGQFATFPPSQPSAAAPSASAYAAGSVAAGGSYSPHGRPPASFGKLLFGGRLLMVDRSGHLQLHSVAKAPPNLLQPLPQAPTASLAAELHLLSSFPGPLGPGSSRDKVAQFCAEQAEAEAGGPPGFVPVHPYGAGPAAGAAERCTLWSVLRVLALHQGKICSAPYSVTGAASGAAGGKPANPNATPEAQLAAALLEGVDSSGSGSLLLPGAAPGPAAEDAAARAQQLLLEGRRSEALEAAIEGRLWGVALLLARLLGEPAVAAVAAALAEQSVAASSPLQTLLLLLGGASPEAPLAAAAAAAVDGAGAVPSLPSAPGAAASGSQVPAVFRPAAVSGVPAPAWRQHLAMLAANRTPGDAAALLLLAGRLLAAGQVLPAHLAFILAGSFPQPWDLAVAAATAPAPAGSAPGQASSPSRTPAPALLAAAAQPGGSPGSNPGSAAAPAAATPPLVLLGADVAGRPRSLAQLPHVLATEVYAWARTAATPLPAGQPSPFLCLAPFSLLHALSLAELGLLPGAAAYSQALAATLQALGGRVPPGLLVCRAAALDFQDRLQQYAQGQKVSLGARVSAGALVSSVGKWLDRGLTAMLGGGEPGSDGGRHSRGPSHSRNPSASSVDLRHEPHKRTASSGSVSTATGDGAFASGQPGAEERRGGLFQRVSSFTGILKSKPKSAAPSQEAVPPDPENVFYYDKELKMWRERGADPPAVPELPAPPPTAAWQAAGTAGGAAAAPAPPPLLPAGTLAAATAPRSSVGSRYALAGSYGAQQPTGHAPGFASMLPSAAAFDAHPPAAVPAFVPSPAVASQPQHTGAPSAAQPSSAASHEPSVGHAPLTGFGAAARSPAAGQAASSYQPPAASRTAPAAGLGSGLAPVGVAAVHPPPVALASPAFPAVTPQPGAYSQPAPQHQPRPAQWRAGVPATAAAPSALPHGGGYGAFQAAAAGDAFPSLHVSAVRRYSTDSTDSGLQPGTVFADQSGFQPGVGGGASRPPAFPPLPEHAAATHEPSFADVQLY